MNIEALNTGLKHSWLCCAGYVIHIPDVQLLKLIFYSAHYQRGVKIKKLSKPPWKYPKWLLRHANESGESNISDALTGQSGAHTFCHNWGRGAWWGKQVGVLLLQFMLDYWLPPAKLEWNHFSGNRPHKRRGHITRRNTQVWFCLHPTGICCWK